MSILGLLENEGDMLLTQLHCQKDTMHFYVIQTGLFSETMSFWHLVVPLTTFAAISNCPWVQGKSNTPLPMCVGDSNSVILPQFLVSLVFINMQMR